MYHCVKSVRIWSSFNPYFQFDCGRIRTRKTPNTDTFHAVNSTDVYQGTILFVAKDTNIFTGRITVEYVDLTFIDHLCQVIVTHVGWASVEDSERLVTMMAKVQVNILCQNTFKHVWKTIGERSKKAILEYAWQSKVKRFNRAHGDYVSQTKKSWSHNS